MLPKSKKIIIPNHSLWWNIKNTYDESFWIMKKGDNYIFKDVRPGTVLYWLYNVDDEKVAFKHLNHFFTYKDPKPTYLINEEGGDITLNISELDFKSIDKSNTGWYKLSFKK